MGIDASLRISRREISNATPFRRVPCFVGQNQLRNSLVLTKSAPEFSPEGVKPHGAPRDNSGVGPRCAHTIACSGDERRRRNATLGAAGRAGCFRRCPPSDKRTRGEVGAFRRDGKTNAPGPVGVTDWEQSVQYLVAFSSTAAAEIKPYIHMCTHRHTQDTNKRRQTNQHTDR